MALDQIPKYTTLQDKQFLSVLGPDGLTTGMQYDAQQRALYFKESQVIFPSFHGATHIAEDPVPQATCDTQGLMAADDKCKLDALLQTRVGILGFQGSGFADDGGWMCFPADSQILKPDGCTVSIDRLQINDEVVSHTGQIRRILQLFKRNYDSNLLEINISGQRPGCFACTPEHPILAVKNNNSLSAIAIAYANLKNNHQIPAWVEAKKLIAGDYIAKRLSSNVIVDRDYILINETACKTEVIDDYAYSIESWQASLGQGIGKHHVKVSTFRNTAKAVPNKIEISPEFLRLCGYYLAEGHIDGPSSRPKKVIFSLHTNEAFGEFGSDLTHCIEFVFGIKPHIKNSPSGGLCVQICIQSAIVARFMKTLLPGTSHTKRIPQWMIELPPEKQKWLLAAFLEGDGHLRIKAKSKTIKCSLCNEQLVNQLCALIERQGASPILSYNQRLLNGKIFNSYCLAVQAAALPWVWRQLGGPELIDNDNGVPNRLDFAMKSNGYTLRRIKSITNRQHNGPVYNIEVDVDNSYVVAGNIVHNCGDIILAAGTEFISLERVGNVVRFTVDSPIPLNCIAAGARILMHDGTTKAIEDIMVDDLVVSHTGHIRHVTQLFRRHYDGPIFEMRARKHSGESVLITGEHAVMAAMSLANIGTATYSTATPEWVRTDRLSKNDLLISRRSHDSIEDRDQIDLLAELGEGFTEHDGLIYSCRTTGPRTGQIDSLAHGVPRYINIDNDFLSLIGYYAAEGCASRKNGIRFSVHANEFQDTDIGSEILRIIRSLFGIEAKVQPRGTSNGRDIQFFCVPIVELFRKWFSGSRHKKQFPTWVMLLPPAKQAVIMAGLMLGDGYDTGKRLRLRMGIRNLVDQAIFMADRCGWQPTHCKPSVVRRRYLAHEMQIANREMALNAQSIDHDNTSFRPITTLQQTPFSGLVYNIEVEEDHSYIVDGIAMHNCACEECQQIFWLQDETDVAAIRPPSCGGKLPGVNAYGELKIYLMPDSMIVDPNNPAVSLNKKDNYPALIFKRYDDAIVPGTAEYELILQRNATNQLQTDIGWAFTPGPAGTAGIAQCVWFVGRDNDGNLLRFDLLPEPTPGLLGALLYNGNLITKKMGVIVDYTSTILSTNQYQVREWDVDNQKPVGDPVTAKNVWQYANPENPPSGKNPRTILLDSGIDLLAIGTLVELWFFKVGEVAGEPIRRYYFSKKPTLNPNNIWTWVGQVQFGDVDVAREELPAGPGSEDKTSAIQVPALRELERTVWGLTGYDDPLVTFDIAAVSGTEAADVSRQHRAVIDPTLPGLRVVPSVNTLANFSERPVWLWNRATMCNALVRVDIGRAPSTEFVPYDIALRAAIDESTDQYMQVVAKGQLSGLHYISVAGVNFNDLPPFGSVRVLSPFTNENNIYNYNRKFAFPPAIGGAGTGGTVGTEPPLTLPDTVILAGGAIDNVPYPGDVGDVLELLHQEYNSPLVRVEFSFNPSTGLVEVQFKVGTLDMSLPYEEDIIPDDADDFVRGLAPGYAVSAVYSQAAPFTGVGTQPDVTPEGFVVYEGGAQVGGVLSEYWNTLEIMLRDNQVWLWWNKLLIPPSTTLSQTLPTPVTISTPYFTIDQDVNRTFGKVGMRLWPGATVRRLDVRTQITTFSEFQYGQLEIS